MLRLCKFLALACLIPAFFWLLTGCNRPAAPAALPASSATPSQIPPRATVTPLADTPTPTLSHTPIIIPTRTPVPTPQILVPAVRLGKGNVITSALSLDGKYLAISSEVGVQLYDSLTFEVIWARRTDKVFDKLAFSPDSRLLALMRKVDSADRFEQNCVIEVWDVMNGTQTPVMLPASIYNSVAWSPDSSELLTKSQDGKIIRWQASTGKQLAQYPIQEDLHSYSDFTFNAVWSSDGERIISTEAGVLKAWDASTGEELFALPYEALGRPPGYVFASPAPGDPRVVVSTFNFEKGAFVIDSRNGSVLQFLDTWLMCPRVAWSQDGKFLTLTQSGYMTIELWDATSYTLLNSIHMSFDPGMHLSPDGQVVYVFKESEVAAIRTRDGMVLRAIKDFVGPIARMRWDQRGIQAEILYQELKTWDADTLELSSTVEQDVEKGFPTIAWAPDRNRRAQYSDGAILIWDAASSQSLYKLPTQLDLIGATPVMVWSPDGTRLAIGDVVRPSMQIWDIQTTTLLCKWVNLSPVYALAWSPDGKRIAISSGEVRVDVRDTTTGEILFRLNGHTKHVDGLAWSPDGKMLVSGDERGNIYLWQVPASP
ncbi:MAG: WD40 repeat domain-containing protein [Chloroflexota bacterium]